MSAAGKTRVSPARHEAFRILLEIERKGLHADDLLRSKRVDALSAADRGLCTAIVLGVLRWQIRLDAMMRPLLARPNAKLEMEVLTVLRMGAFQHLFLDRVPAHAAIGESVAMCKASGHTFASRMVNAVLRKVAAWPKLTNWDLPETADARALADAAAHPERMVKRWVQHYGAEVAREICRHGQEQPELTVRLAGKDAEAGLAAQGVRLEAGSLLTAARTVAEGSFDGLEGSADAVCRIQDEGSQLIGELAGAVVDSPGRILDCCAAPGGKTLILAELWPAAQVVAMELQTERCEALRNRVLAAASAVPERYGRIAVQQGDAAAIGAFPDSSVTPEYLAGGFDLILADVPCSGTGTLGRNPEIRHRLMPEGLAWHHDRQTAILSSVLQYAEKMAEPGRRVCVVYSTCSLEPEENEGVVNEVLKRVEGWRQVSLAETVERLRERGRLADAGREVLARSLTAEGAMLLLPGTLIAGTGTKLKTDGFFAALIEQTF